MNQYYRDYLRRLRELEDAGMGDSWEAQILRRRIANIEREDRIYPLEKTPEVVRLNRKPRPGMV